MPTECVATEYIPSQRSLADGICRQVPLDELRILIACGAKVDEPVTLGLRPLHYACWQNYSEAAKFLLVRGCSVDVQDDAGYTALHIAAEHGHDEIIDTLISNQAKVHARPYYLRNTLCYLILHSQSFMQKKGITTPGIES